MAGSTTRGSRVQYNCSFCGKNQDQVKRLIAGPGALTSIVLLMGRAGDSLLLKGAVLAALLAVMVIMLIVLLAGDRMNRLLGETGINVVGRVLGIVLAALAVQYVIDGIKEAF